MHYAYWRGRWKGRTRTDETKSAACPDRAAVLAVVQPISERFGMDTTSACGPFIAPSGQSLRFGASLPCARMHGGPRDYSGNDGDLGQKSETARALTPAVSWFEPGVSALVSRMPKCCGAFSLPDATPHSKGAFMTEQLDLLPRDPHWAANRRPDFTHNGRRFWCAPHDHQPRILLQYWYCEGDPTGRKGQFDVRDLPNYAPFPERMPRSGGMEVFIPWLHAEKQHHAGIIIAAINAGFDLAAVTHSVGDGA